MSTPTAATPRLHEREPQTVARDAAYALAALVDEAVEAVRTARERTEQFRDEAPEKFEQLRAEAPEKVQSLPEDVEARLAELRARATTALDERLVELESSFDTRAAAGAEVVARLRRDERVTRVEEAFAPVGEQAEIARRQVKGAVTSVRRTLDLAVDAGRAQADTARSQVRAAATSTRRTVESAVEAVGSIAS